MTRDWFTEAFGTAVADVRRELVEKAWFGAAERAAPAAPGDWRSSLWGEPDHARTDRTDIPDPDRGIDR